MKFNFSLLIFREFSVIMSYLSLNFHYLMLKPSAVMLGVLSVCVCFAGL